MFNKSYDWACTLLWTGICLTVLILGWSVLYAPYWWSLTIVAVLLALFVIMGYIQYTKVLALKRKFIVVQETFTTAMLVYFAFFEKAIYKREGLCYNVPNRCSMHPKGERV